MVQTIQTASVAREPKINSARAGLFDRAPGAGFEDMLQKKYKALNNPTPCAEPEDCHDDALLEKIRFYIDDFVFKSLIDFGYENESALHNIIAENERLGLDPAAVAEEMYDMGLINEEQRDRLAQGQPIN